MPGDDAKTVTKGGPSLGQSQQVKDIVPVDHHATQHGELGNGGTNQTHVGSKQFAVKGLGFNGAAIQDRAFQLRQVIRMQGTHLELQCTLVLELLNGLGGCVDERLSELRVRARSHRVV